MAVEAGQRLLHYRLIEKIGEGGMGVVWKAEDTKLRRHVALKVLPPSMAADPDRCARFEREARAVAALNHPNIVTLHSVEEAETPTGIVRFITMEVVEGRTLSRLLPKSGFSLDRLLDIAIPLADAVSRAHRTGVTHRDLKPDNIMIDGEGRLRVLDFGLAKLTEPAGATRSTQMTTVTSDTADGRVLGTVAYMSPEQAEGKKVDARSDIFSLGTILYEMASGSRPFRGRTNMSTIGAILKDEPRSVTELKPSLPPDVGRIVRRCLAKDPEFRYQTALDVRNELVELKREIDAGEARTPTPATFRRLWKPAALVLGVLLAAVAGWTVLRDGRSVSQPPSRYTSRPITSVVGYDSSINWSPEGEFITFGRVRNGSYDIMVQPVAGGEAVVRAEGPGDETAPRWSPDGRFLAYVSSSYPGSPILLTGPHSGTARKLIETGISTLDLGALERSMGDRPWSADGRTLLASIAVEGGGYAVHRIARDTEMKEQLTFPPVGGQDVDATYSFDGAQIAFSRHTQGRWSILSIPATGGEPQPLVADEFLNRGPRFHPDGRHLLFHSDRGGALLEELWKLDLESGRKTPLTSDSDRIVSSSVSPTGDIAYVPFEHDTFLFTVELATGKRRQLTSHTQDNFGARFGPDGRTIAYHSSRLGDGSEVFLYHFDGTAETRITNSPSWDVYPDWSPDGGRIAFASDRRDDGKFRLYVANSDGGGERQLVDELINGRIAYSPVNSKLVCRWSPDGRRVAYIVTKEEGSSLWSVNADGTEAREHFRSVVAFDWYRDARHGIFTRVNGSVSDLMAIDLETGEEALLFSGPLMEIDVAPDGSAVSFCLGQGHMSMGLAVLKLEQPDGGGLPRAVGNPEYVVATEGTWHVHNGGWSPDSKSIVYTRDQDYGDILELVERR